MLPTNKRVGLFRDSLRTVITEVNIFDVFNSRKRLKRSMNASELIQRNEVSLSLDLVAEEEWVQIPITKVIHYFSLSTAYTVQLRFGDKEDSPVMTVDKIFVMNGKFDFPVYIRSLYVVDNNYQYVGCTLEVS